MIIDKKFLTDNDACTEGVIWFDEHIKISASHSDIITQLISTDDYNKIKWCNWLIAKLFDKKQKIQYAIFAAELVIHIFEKKYPDDTHPRDAINIAKKYLKTGDYAADDDAANVAYATAHVAANAAHVAYATAHVAARKSEMIKIISYGLELLENGGGI